MDLYIFNLSLNQPDKNPRNMVWWFLSSLLCEKMLFSPLATYLHSSSSQEQLLDFLQGSEFIYQNFVYFPYYTDACVLCFLFVPTAAALEQMWRTL